MASQEAMILERERPFEDRSIAEPGLAAWPSWGDGGCANLRDLVTAELAQPVAPEIRAMAAGIAARHPGARAVLFYGSCLRETRFDGRMLDFYLIVADYRQAYDRPWLAAANRLLPPNVFPLEQGGLMAKYAVLSEDDFSRLCSGATRSVSVWARFAQPSRLVWSADGPAAERAISAVTGAAPALLSAVRPCLADRMHPLELWTRALELTYSAELRPERNDRAGSLVAADLARYRVFAAPALRFAGFEIAIDGDALVFVAPMAPAELRRARRQWRQRQREGKLLNVLRLAKASATYTGGLDYLAWKIARHTGVKPEIRPWQRRWPLLGALCHLPGLLARGAVK